MNESECRKKRRWRKRFAKKPHVVFVLADDFGFNDIGYHGKNYGSRMYTPFLNSLAGKNLFATKYENMNCHDDFFLD